MDQLSIAQEIYIFSLYYVIFVVDITKYLINREYEILIHITKGS